MLSERFDDALAFTARLHRDQQRKGKDTPYIAHLMSVAALVIESGGSEDEAIAALLHDAVEDQGGHETLATIEARYGAEVARIVAGCTDAWTEPKPEWRPRKERYLAHLEDADPAILRVSCADKVHNARSIMHDLQEEGEALWSRFNGKRDGTLWYYRALAEAFARLDTPERLASQLSRAVDRMESLAQRVDSNT